MNAINYYVAVRFILSLFKIIFTVIQPYHIMATAAGNLSSDVTMESLMSEIRNLKAELTAIQAHEGLQNLSLDERDSVRGTRPNLTAMSSPHNAKIQYFGNLPGENFLAWRSQFQVIAKFNRWNDEEAKSMVFTYIKDTALESIMDVALTGTETITEILDKYQDRFLPECRSQLLRAQFACVVQLPNESVQKLHARLRVLYHLAYPEARDCSEIYLIEKFVAALNNREVQNHVCRQKPTTYAKPLNIANEKISLVLMDLATHAPGGLQAPTPGDTSFIATIKGRWTDTRRSSMPCRKCYCCDEEGHFKERCPLWLKDFLKQWADRGNRKATRLQEPTAANRASRTTSPKARRKQVKFAETQQILPIVTGRYGRKQVTALEENGGTPEAEECQELLEGVDLAALDTETVAALLEEL